MLTYKAIFLWISYQKKIWVTPLHEILWKKMFCAKKVTKLPDLTVCFYWSIIQIFWKVLDTVVLETDKISRMISVSLSCRYSPRKVKSSNKMESPPPEKNCYLFRETWHRRANKHRTRNRFLGFIKFLQIRAQDDTKKRVVVPAPRDVIFKLLRRPGIDSTSQCSQAVHNDNTIPTRFLAPIDCSKSPTQAT